MVKKILIGLAALVLLVVIGLVVLLGVAALAVDKKRNPGKVNTTPEAMLSPAEPVV